MSEVSTARFVSRCPRLSDSKLPSVQVTTYRPTDRNELAREHYAKLGFKPIGARDTSLMKRVESSIDQSRAVVAAQHMLFENVDEYVSLYLRYGDKADFLRPPFGPVWQKSGWQTTTVCSAALRTSCASMACRSYSFSCLRVRLESQSERANRRVSSMTDAA